MDKQLDIRRPVPQKHHGLSTVSKIFFGVDIFQVVIVVVFQSTLVACGNFNAYNSPENPGMGPGRRIYMCVYMGVIVYTCFLCLFAVKEKNFVEILAFLLQNFGFVAYGLIQVYHVGYKKHPVRGSNATMQHSPLLRNIALTNSLVLFLLNGVFIFLSWKLYIEFGWKIYKRVRFNLSLRSVYHYYQLLICLLKMAIMYWWMYAICNSFVLLRDHHSVMYFINLGGFIPISVVFACLGYFATQREIKSLMVFFILWTFCLIGYFMYKLYGFITDNCNGCQEFHKTGKDIHDEALLHFVYLGTLNLLLLLAILGVACKVFSNFGKGLAQHFKPRSDKRRLRAGTADLYLRRVSHYVEESVVSATSYESEHDELQDSTRLGLGYQQLTLTTGAVLLNGNARVLASSMPNLFESTQKAHTFPVGKEHPNLKDAEIKPSAISNGIVSATLCTLAVIDEDDDLMKDEWRTPPNMKKLKTSKINGQRKNERKELPGNRINERCINGTNRRSEASPIKETIRTYNKDLKNHHDLNGIRPDDDDDDDDVFTDRVDERNSRDSGFMESPRESDKIKDKFRTRKTPIICIEDDEPTNNTSTSHRARNGRDKGPSAGSLNRTNEAKKKISLI